MPRHYDAAHAARPQSTELGSSQWLERYAEEYFDNLLPTQPTIAGKTSG